MRTGFFAGWTNVNLANPQPMKTRFRLLPTLSMIALLVFITGGRTQAANAERREHKELPVAKAGTLTFKAMVGSIEIRTANQEQVTFDSVIKRGGWGLSLPSDLIELVEFHYETSGADAKIEVKWKANRGPRFSNLNVRHTLIVPTHYNVDVSTAGGSIQSDNIGGNVVAATSGGRIQLSKVGGQVKARTSGGSIALEKALGDADLRTSGGSIKVGLVDGRVNASTSGGSISVEGAKGNLRARTSGGSVSASVASQINSPLELSTSGGSIRLTVPSDFRADLDASTSGGGVSCDLPVDGSVKRNFIRGKLNGGGPQVTLRTSGGSVRVSTH